MINSCASHPVLCALAEAAPVSFELSPCLPRERSADEKIDCLAVAQKLIFTEVDIYELLC